MARVRLGDIVRMPLPDQPSPDFFYPELPPMVPSLPTDVANSFFSSMEQGSSQGMPYASPTQSEFPPLDNVVVGGPMFVPTQPRGGLPITGNPGAIGKPVSAFARSSILPDSILPAPLQRAGMLNRQSIYRTTAYDQAIAGESRFWEWIASHGGIKTCCRIPEMGAPIYSYPPWQVMPSSGLRFQEIFFQTLANVSGGPPFNGVDTVLGNFRCEVGFDGVITHFVCGFTGNGFDDGSGQILWRLKIGQRFAKTLGSVNFTFGDLQTALTVPGSGYRMISGQTVQLIANIPNGSPVNGGRVFAGVIGWTYPRR